eukprot:5687862-Pyramimonas_sp.AAC.1
MPCACHWNTLHAPPDRRLNDGLTSRVPPGPWTPLQDQAGFRCYSAQFASQAVLSIMPAIPYS